MEFMIEESSRTNRTALADDPLGPDDAYPRVARVTRQLEAPLQPNSEWRRSALRMPVE
jgi:hypothetical protein